MYCKNAKAIIRLYNKTLWVSNISFLHEILLFLNDIGNGVFEKGEEEKQPAKTMMKVLHDEPKFLCAMKAILCRFNSFP